MSVESIVLGGNTIKYKKTIVGEVAKERAIVHPELSASVFKRNMGTRQIYKLGKREFLPEELSSLILKSLKRDAETKFLVFDLGGGTFDVSILELFDGIIEGVILNE